jgi:hypothetical protein
MPACWTAVVAGLVAFPSAAIIIWKLVSGQAT